MKCFFQELISWAWPRCWLCCLRLRSQPRWCRRRRFRRAVGRMRACWAVHGREAPGCNMVLGLYEVIQYTHTLSLLSRTPKTAVKDHTFLSAQQNQVASTAKILRVSANRPPTAALPGAGAALSLPRRMCNVLNCLMYISHYH